MKKKFRSLLLGRGEASHLELRDDIVRETPYGKIRSVPRPVAGAHAEIVDAFDGSRMTASRVVGGAVLLGPVGAVIGALARKDTSAVVVAVTFADGHVAYAQVPRKRNIEARKFVDLVNAAAEHYAAVEPEPEPEWEVALDAAVARYRDAYDRQAAAPDPETYAALDRERLAAYEDGRAAFGDEFDRALGR